MNKISIFVKKLIFLSNIREIYLSKVAKKLVVWLVRQRPRSFIENY